jgi:phenylalanyl-tRNA synthetase beta chain
MDIKILDSWLREYLETNAMPADIARCLSLCGPSIEKIEKVTTSGKPDFLYNIEVTTNRVDMMSVWGIAREAVVILPQFGFKAKLTPPKLDDGAKHRNDNIDIRFVTDGKLVYRMIGVVMEVDKINPSPEVTKERLESSGIRSLNDIVDVTNYVMTEIGHPAHVFDYDLVKPVLRARESKKGEAVQSFDGKEYKLPGGDIVFENSEGSIVDLPGIIGTKNSDENTQRILFFIDTNNPINIRRTSMTLGIRTVAATLNEKGVDAALAETALKRGIYLYKKLGLKQVSPIIDVDKSPAKIKSVSLDHALLTKKLGIEITPEKVKGILNSLGIKTEFDNKSGSYVSIIPSLRSKDIEIQEDLIEEVARIYGYHNLPSTIMMGGLPQFSVSKTLEAELKIKMLLKALGGIETYTLSLVPSSSVSGSSIKIKNPLGPETEYLRNSMMPSLVDAYRQNNKWSESFHLFEVSNVYIPKNGELPEEKMILAGVIKSSDSRQAKGLVESLLDNLNIEYTFELLDSGEFLANQSLTVIAGKKKIGKFGSFENGAYYYEFPVSELLEYYKGHGEYTDIPKFPAQIEDMTLIFPERTLIGEVYEFLKSFDPNIANVELKDVYKDSYSFRIWYQSREKTLENYEVEKIRNSLLNSLSQKYKVTIK